MADAAFAQRGGRQRELRDPFKATEAQMRGSAQTTEYSSLRPWLRKFLQHGNGVAIVRAYTSSSWWHEEMPKAELICFPRGKTKFIRPAGEVGTAPGHGIVLVGAGTVACDALMRSGLGMIWDRRKPGRCGGSPVWG